MFRRSAGLFSARFLGGRSGESRICFQLHVLNINVRRGYVSVFFMVSLGVAKGFIEPWN